MTYKAACIESYNLQNKIDIVLFASTVLRVKRILEDQCQVLADAIDNVRQSLERGNKRPASADSNTNQKPAEKRTKQNPSSKTTPGEGQIVKPRARASSSELEKESGDTSSESERDSPDDSGQSEEEDEE
jgi:hypothetical protein